MWSIARRTPSPDPNKEARTSGKKSRVNGTIRQRVARSGFGVTRVKKKS
jgi:hypothetical protein